MGGGGHGGPKKVNGGPHEFTLALLNCMVSSFLFRWLVLEPRPIKLFTLTVSMLYGAVGMAGQTM